MTTPCLLRGRAAAQRKKVSNMSLNAFTHPRAQKRQSVLACVRASECTYELTRTLAHTHTCTHMHKCTCAEQNT